MRTHCRALLSRSFSRPSAQTCHAGGRVAGRCAAGPRTGSAIDAGPGLSRGGQGHRQGGRRPDAPRDYLAYLKGRALWLANRYDEAAAAFDAMPKEFPRSPWLRQAASPRR